MIVCVCNALRENQVREAARVTRSDCPVTAYAKLGCKPKCGQCLPFAREVLARESSFA
ncbi:MAG: (2Fe-2S)-binding protein [Alphaproteobacteria bacterium]|uniref:(2Fe-2S)-binding protein n=1 Tax=Sandarakinorhabdus sp. DWP1-3-1 TaxID=2804627 RepID=UPI000DB2D666|nr:MAG: (2Fe-2S)-binding protein [Alphaproteobacteria bacterium]